MRILIVSLFCFSLAFIGGCTKNQEEKVNQARSPISDEQNAIPPENPATVDAAKKEPAAPEVEQAAKPTETADDAAHTHYLAFFSHLKTDQDAALAELSTYVKLRFEAHPLAEKWLTLADRLVRDGEGTFVDLKHYTEWHLQMLTDVAPENRTAQDTELLEMHQGAMKQIEMIGTMLEQQGEDLDTYQMPASFIGQ